ncbi:hypothetical protein HY994_03400 [Candidatus Micrarchaeota archaeon]|nr:hypothetical protein [Candidatus Micrarchaeota archaeon]
MYGTQQQTQCGNSCSSTDYARMLAHWAKMELLKEKVKARMDEKYGKQLDALADLIAEVVMDDAKTQDEAESRDEKLETAFDQLDGE